MARKIQKPTRNAKTKQNAPEPPTGRRATGERTAPGAQNGGNRNARREPHVLSFQQRVYAVVRQCPHGKAISYGAVAALIGQPRAARAVGHALSMLDAGTDVPWWRVVNRNGEVSIKSADHAPIVQRKLLEGEGIRFERDRIDWEQFGWTGESAVVPVFEAVTDFDDGSRVTRRRRRKV